MNKLLELAERVEKAEGPDRELDARIWCALNGKRYQSWFDVYGPNSGRLTQVEFTEPPRRTRVVTDDARFKHALPYTASIDAAMTLVPEGWTFWEVYTKRRGLDTEQSNAEVSRLTEGGDEEGHISRVMKRGAAALALTAAALRARAAQEVEPRAG